MEPEELEQQQQVSRVHRRTPRPLSKLFILYPQRGTTRYPRNATAAVRLAWPRSAAQHRVSLPAPGLRYCLAPLLLHQAATAWELSSVSRSVAESGVVPRDSR